MDNNIAQKQYEADIFSREFREDFYSKFGVIPSVIYNMASNVKQVESLDTLIQMTNVLLWKAAPGQFPEGIKEKNRDRTLVTYRHLFCYMAREMGYSLSQIGIIIDRDHCTVLHSTTKISNWLEMQDKPTELLVQGFKNRLTEKHGEKMASATIFSAEQIVDSNLPKLLKTGFKDIRNTLITIVQQYGEQFKIK